MEKRVRHRVVIWRELGLKTIDVIIIIMIAFAYMLTKFDNYLMSKMAYVCSVVIFEISLRSTSELPSYPVAKFSCTVDSLRGVYGSDRYGNPDAGCSDGVTSERACICCYRVRMKAGIKAFDAWSLNRVLVLYLLCVHGIREH